MAINNNNTDPSTAKLFTDLGQLNSLKQQAGKDGQKALREVSQQFEQMFMNMMLQGMRKANQSLVKDSPFNSSETQFFQDMLDQQVTLELATKGKGIGLADVIVRQLSQNVKAEVDSVSDQVSEPSAKNQFQTEDILRRAYDAAANVAASAVLSNAVDLPQGVDKADATSKLQADIESAIGNFTAELKNADLPDRFESPKEFVEKLMPIAERIAPELGVDPRVLLAQSALETGWGKYVTTDQASGRSSYNLFNIKADSRWGGESVAVQTLEYREGIPAPERANFRAYDSYADSFRDYVTFLKGSSRYQLALEQAGDPSSYLRELQDAGYATDPEYAAKIESIFSGDLLASLNVGRDQG